MITTIVVKFRERCDVMKKKKTISFRFHYMESWTICVGKDKDKFQHPYSSFQCWKMVKCKLVLDENVLSTLHVQGVRGAKFVYNELFQA